MSDHRKGRLVSVLVSFVALWGATTALAIDFRIASWNFRSPAISRALIRAHQRGVSVRVIMDYGNWNPDIPNAIAKRAHDAFDCHVSR